MCRRKVRMSGLCKVEMSAFMDGRGPHGNGAHRFEPTRAGQARRVGEEGGLLNSRLLAEHAPMNFVPVVRVRGGMRGMALLRSQGATSGDAGLA